MEKRPGSHLILTREQVSHATMPRERNDRVAWLPENGIGEVYVEQLYLDRGSKPWIITCYQAGGFG